MNLKQRLQQYWNKHSEAIIALFVALILVFTGLGSYEAGQNDPNPEVVTAIVETLRPTLEAELQLGGLLARDSATPDGRTGTPTGATSTPCPCFPVGTETPVLTETPAPTDTPPGPTPTAVSSSLPACEDHDPEVWHALIRADGACSYDHEHKEDGTAPEVVAKFGQPGDRFGKPGQSVSYPHQTHEENLVKHEAYGTVVRLDMGNPTGADVWINSVRIQAHFDMLPFICTLADGSFAWCGGFLGRQHSVWNELEGCSAAGCGLAYFGGHLNYGNLEIRKGNEVVTLCGLPADPGGCPPGPGGNKIHFDSPGFPPALPNAATTFWYGEPHPTTGGPSNEFFHPLVESFSAADVIGEVSPEALINPLEGVFCPDAQCNFNGSTMALHVLQFEMHNNVDGSALDEDGEQDGFVTLHAFTNVYMVIDPACQATSETCVPLILEHFPVGSYTYRDSDHGIGVGGVAERDTSPEGEHRITWFADMLQQLAAQLEAAGGVLPILNVDH